MVLDYRLKLKYKLSAIFTRDKNTKGVFAGIVILYMIFRASSEPPICPGKKGRALCPR